MNICAYTESFRPYIANPIAPYFYRVPEKHFIVTALTYLKFIFYMKSFDSYSVVQNEVARKLLVPTSS